MNTFAEIIRHWSHSRHEPVALATVVRTTGSTYRKPGARMLVHADGAMAGMVSGGCLERELAERATRIIRGEKPQLVAYDTRRLFGCNGSLEVFIECVPPECRDHLLTAVEDGLRERHTLVGTTIFEASERAKSLLGSRPLFGCHGEPAAACSLPQGMYADGRGALAGEAALERSYPCCGGMMAALLQAIPPPPRIYVFGAHPDVVPLALLCLQLSWQPVVVVHPSQERPGVPPGCEVLHLAAEELAATMAPDARTAAVIMTHNYGRDLACLAALLPGSLPYVGLLGPATRRNKLLGDLADQGIVPAGRMMERLHGPAGLDIGADGPVEVALSIISEIKAVMSGRAGGPLREAVHPIHATTEGLMLAG